MGLKGHLFLASFVYTVLLFCPAESIDLEVDAFVGVILDALTPMDKNGKINPTVIEAQVNLMIGNGVKGIIVCGTYGECNTLTFAERKQLISLYVEVGKGLIEIYLQVGGLPLVQIKELAIYAELLGVTAIITLPDLYYKPTTVDQLIWYINEIASEVPNTPVLYYDIPERTCVDLDMTEFMKKCPCAVENFAGIKTSVPTAIEISANVDLGPNLRILANVDIYLGNLGGLLGPVDGLVSSLANGLVGDVVDIVNSLLNDLNIKVDANVRLGNILSAIVNVNVGESESNESIAAIKAAVSLLLGSQYDMGPTRAPIPSIGKERMKTMAKNLLDLDVKLDIDNLLGLGIDVNADVNVNL